MIRFFFIFLFLSCFLYADFSQIYRDILNYQFEKAADEISEQNLFPAQKNFLESLLLGYRGNYAEAYKRIKDTDIKTDFDWKNYFKKMAEISLNFIEKKSGIFTVRFYSQDKVMFLFFDEISNKISSEVSNFFRIKEKNVIFEIYPDKEKFLFASTLSEEELNRSGTVAIAKFGRLMILSPRLLPYGYNWQNTVCHEFIHHIIARKTALNIPLFLNEGLAKTFEIIWRGEKPQLSEKTKDILARAKKEGFISFEKFKRGMPSLSSQDEVSRAFAEVNFFVLKLIEEFGMNKISRFLEDCKVYGFLKSFNKNFINFKNFLKDFWNLLENNNWQYRGFVEDFIYWKKTDTFFPYSISDYIRLGDRLRMKEKFSLALIQYKKALEKEPENSLIHIKIAKTFLKLGKKMEANEHFQKALKNAPQNFIVLTNYADFLFMEGRFKECIPLMEKAIQKNPFFRKGYRILIESARKTGHKKLKEKYQKIFSEL